jgi:hypothetical protein
MENVGQNGRFMADIRTSLQPQLKCLYEIVGLGSTILGVGLCSVYDVERKLRGIPAATPATLYTLLLSRDAVRLY